MFTRSRRTLALMACVPALAVAGATASVSASATTPATETADGVVYNDLDRDGKRDSNEPGIKGVAVSNGTEVVTTDAHGRYELAAPAGTTIFITKPRGYMVPVNDVNLPQFYYHHFPQGSPVALKYGGVKPTGPLPDSVDFALHPVKDPAAFSPLFFADPQTKTPAEVEDMAKDVVKELEGTSAPFGITVGDVVNDPLDLFDVHNRAIAKIGVPWWNLPGNHDMDFDAPTDEHATDTYKQTFGPTDYSFDYGNVHFVAMDNVFHEGPGKGYIGYVNKRQLTWLANDLAKVPASKLIVLATHIPLKTDATNSPGVNTTNLPELLKVLEGREHIYSVSGHDTSNSWQMYLGEKDGWTGSKPLHHQVLAEVRGAGWTRGPEDERGVRQADMVDGNPNGYYRMAFQGNTYRAQFKPASLPADFLMRIGYRDGAGTSLTPGGRSGSGDFETPVVVTPTELKKGSGVHVEVNVFDGGVRNKVEMSVDGRSLSRLAHSRPVNDPYIVNLLTKFAGTPDAPGTPEPSSHIWTATLPSNLGPGRHTVTVRSTDQFGQVAQRVSTFTVGHAN